MRTVDDNTFNIFDDITEDDVEICINSSVMSETPQELFDGYKGKYSESIFIDINTTTALFNNELVIDRVRKLVRQIVFLFDLYNIEHSDFILSDVEGHEDANDVEVIDCGEYKHITKKIKKDVEFPEGIMLFTYVNYPKMLYRRLIVMFIRMLRCVWNWNSRSSDFNIFNDVVVVKSFITNIQYLLHWYNFKHMLLLHTYADELNDIVLSDNRSIINWYYYQTVSEWFCGEKKHDMIIDLMNGAKPKSEEILRQREYELCHRIICYRT